MNKCSIRDLSGDVLKGKRVFVRVDFNVPMKAGHITDDGRIRESLDTIRYLMAQHAKVILASHMGRPDGEVVSRYSLKPIAERLSELLNQQVNFASDCIGPDATEKANKLQNGEILVLENLRFHKEETTNDPAFAKQLAQLADIFVNDAFGTAHRAHASTEGIAHYLPAYSGLLIQKEIEFLAHHVHQPKRPFLAIIGGAKISTKLGVLVHLLDKVDSLAIGGAMTYTFLKAQGLEVGKSMVETDMLDTAAEFLNKAEHSKTKVILPVDHVVAPAFDNNAPTQIVDSQHIPTDQMGLDVGPQTIRLLESVIQNAKTIIWNGPLGVFELEAFSKGTFAVAHAIAQSTAVSIIGGGDSAAAVKKAGVQDKITHISTGGGASLEFLEGKALPGIAILKDKAEAKMV